MSATSPSDGAAAHYSSFAVAHPQRPSLSSQTLFQHSPSAAPLPSPTATADPSQYFASLHGQAGAQTQHAQMEAQVQAQQLQLQQQQQQQRQMIVPNAFEYRPERGDAGSTAVETSNLLRDYSLLAEAAKRAQMAVLERDLGGMEVS